MKVKSIKKEKAEKLQWKHICLKLNIKPHKGVYLASDIQKYIDYCCLLKKRAVIKNLRINMNQCLNFGGIYHGTKSSST